MPDFYIQCKTLFKKFVRFLFSQNVKKPIFIFNDQIKLVFYMLFMNLFILKKA